MSNVTQREALKLIAKRADFQGSNFSGFNHAGVYYVASYDTVIARYDGTWALNPNKYSVTTSRHLGIVKRAVSGATLKPFDGFQESLDW